MEKYYITYIRNDTEKILKEFDDESKARVALNAIKDNNNCKVGAFALVYGRKLPNGKIDIFGQRLLDSYSPAAEEFLKKILK